MATMTDATTNTTTKKTVIRKSSRSMPRRVLNTVPVPPKTLPRPEPRDCISTAMMSAMDTMIWMIWKYWRYGERKCTRPAPVSLLRDGLPVVASDDLARGACHSGYYSIETLTSQCTQTLGILYTCRTPSRGSPPTGRGRSAADGARGRRRVIYWRDAPVGGVATGCAVQRRAPRPAAEVTGMRVEGGYTFRVPAEAVY